MILRRVGVAAFAAGLALLSLPQQGARAQESEECQGSRPRGGMWVASGELYMDRAARNPKREEKLKLYQQAVDILTEGFEKQPENPKNYVLAGQAYIGLGDYATADSLWAIAEEMWTCYDEEIDSLRYDAGVRAFNLGVRYMNAGEPERAVEYYEQAYTIYDELPQPLIQLATFYAKKAQETADPDTAAEARAKAIELYTQALGTLNSPRLSGEDRATYERATYFNLAQLLAFEDRFEEAAKAYEDYLRIAPDDATAKSNAAVVLTLAADQAEDQAAELEEGEERAALEAKAAELRARANVHYADLLARDDLSADDYHNIGAGLARSRDYEQAAAAFNKALELQPYRPNTLEQLGFVLYSAGRYDTLVAVAQKLVDRYPLNLNNLALVANAYRELEQPDSALKYLQLREDLKVELMRLELKQKDGGVAILGIIQNIGLEPGTPIHLEFQLRDDAGEVVATVDRTFEAPEQGVPARFSIEAETETAVSGFTYRLVETGGEATGTG